MKRTGGLRRKTRYLFKKHRSAKGKISLANYLQEFKAGEKVILSLESAVQKGMYHPRFYGKMGKISGKKGRCYEVSITEGNNEKTVIAHPVHLKRI
jgi:large subunit ribosomal protein L21e